MSTPPERADAAELERLLWQQLERLFGSLEPATAQFLRRHLQWLEVAAGSTLMKQGDAGDDAYLLVSGRLHAYLRDESGPSRLVREMSRGELIGELAMYTGEARSATVVAVRDSVLVRLARAHLAPLLATSPQVSIAFTSRIIRRLRSERDRRRLAAPVTIGLAAISDGVALADFARALAAQLARHGRVRLLDAEAIAAETGVPGIAARSDAEAELRMARAIDAQEAQHDFVLLQADAADPWTRCCLRHSDEIVLLADAAQPPRVHPLEATLAARESAAAAEILVLLQPPARVSAQGTAAWLARRPLAGHVHVRRDHGPDLARLARLLSRNAVGLVFGGGGARGFAHLGVWRALHAHGIEVDCVGGTSIGAVMAALVAADPTCERAIEIARRAFGRNPTGDFNLLPMVSLIKGGRVREAIERSIVELAGGAIDIADLWKSFFCVATNYSQAAELVLARGDLSRALRATTAIAGALPPVVLDGDLVCDGGTFNNYPVDLMRQMRGVGPVIGVDLGGRSPRRLEFDEVPSNWALLRDRLRGRAHRRYRLPSLPAYLLNISILCSSARQRQERAATDLYFNPPLYRIGLLQWQRFDEILRQGERHANEVLAALPAEQRAALGVC